MDGDPVGEHDVILAADLTHDHWEDLWHLICADLARRRVILARAERRDLLPRPGEVEDIERLAALCELVYEQFIATATAPAPPAVTHAGDSARA